MSRIFISHSSADARETVALKQWLSDQDPPLANEIFVDHDRITGIPVGTRWKDELKRASSRCEAVVCLLSTNWEASDYCRIEFGVAENLGKKIICARLEESAGGGITSEWQRCDLFGDGPKTPIDIGDGKPPVAFASDGLERLKLAICGQGVGAESFVWPPNNEPDRAPYRGWDPFEDIDAGVFFGRDAPIVTGLDGLRVMRSRGTESLFVIQGPSGAGKSSYLRAGLLPRLRREDRRFLVLDIIRPKRNALTGSSGVAQAIFATRSRLNLKQPDVGEIKSACQDDAGRIRDLLVECQRSASDRFVERDGEFQLPTVVLPVDQAEELFAADAGAEARQFMRLITQLATAGEDRLAFIVIATIRTDRYQYMQTAPELDGLQTYSFTGLRAMPATLFKDVIAGPAKRSTESDHPFRTDPELVERLLEDCSKGGGETLPILSLTLSRLYHDYSADGVLTLDEYEQMGGLSGVVQAEVARVLATDDQQRTAQLKLLRNAFIPWLVSVNDEDRPMRRRARWTDLPEASRPLISEFVENHLLTTDSNSDQAVVEVTSECLLTEWADLNGWLVEEGANLRRVDTIERNAADWKANDGTEHASDYLLTGQRLATAEGLANSEIYGPRLRGVGDFLHASRAHVNDLLAQEVEKEQAHSRKLKKYLAVVATLLVLTLVSAGVAVVMMFQANDAESKAIAAEQEAVWRYHEAVSTRLVSQAQAALAGGRPDGDARAFQQLLAARALTDEPDDGAVFSAAIQRLNTLKIIDAPRVVRGVAFSQDGRRVASASIEDRAVRIWDAESGQPIGTPQAGHTDEVVSVAFSPDGSRVVTASADKTLRIWNAETGQPDGPPLTGHTGAVYSVAFSPDGRTIVSGGTDRTVRRWDVQRRQEIGPPIEGHADVVWSVAYSPDGRSIASSGADETIRRWKAIDGQPAGPPSTGHTGIVWSVGYSPDSQRIVSGGQDRTLQRWDAQTGQRIGEPMIGHRNEVFSAVYTSDGRIVSGGDSTVRVWDADTGHSLGVPLTGHTNAVMAVAISPRADKIISGSTDNTVRLWDARNIRPIGVPGSGHDGAVQSVAINRDGDRIASASADRTLVLWDTQTIQPIFPPMTGHTEGVFSVAFSPDGTQIASGSADKTIRLWTGRDGRPLGVPMTGHTGVVRTVAFSPDGQRIVSGGDDGTIRVWDVKSGSQILGPIVSDTGKWVGGVFWDPRVLSVAFSPDGTRIVSGGHDRTLHLWDANTGAPVGQPFSGHEGSIKSIAFSGDGLRIVSGSADTTIRVWEVATGHQMGPQFTGHLGSVTSVALSPDGQRVVSGSVDNSVRLWNADNGKPFGQPLYGHQTWVLSVTFSPDGGNLISGSGDTTLRVWPAVVNQDVLCDKLTTNMSHKHWREWVADNVDYVKVCEQLPVPPDD